jgi:hypothetical protein
MRISSLEQRLSAEDSALTQRFHEEHRDVSRVITNLLRVTDDLNSVAAENDLTELRNICQSLVDIVLPHENAEESLLYPALGAFFGGGDPMATMSRAHIEITHRIHRLGQLLDEIGTSADEIDLIELRRTLYGLYAILKLHTAQEEESYLSLGDDVDLDTVASKVASVLQSETNER